MSLHDRVEAASITLMHKYLYSLFVDPTEMLVSAGLKKGDKVLEVGFGPGFFTIPAADIVGKDGFIYAIEINPIFVKKVKRKIEKMDKNNIEIKLENVLQTSLDDNSIDVAFFFGVFHNLTAIIDELVKEMYRILKPGGLMSIQKSGRPMEKYLNQITKSGKFEVMEIKKRVILVKKKKEK